MERVKIGCNFRN
jgi:hypothetical protein